MLRICLRSRTEIRIAQSTTRLSRFDLILPGLERGCLAMLFQQIGPKVIVNLHSFVAIRSIRCTRILLPDACV